MYLFLDTETHHVENPIMIQLAYKPDDRLEYFSSLYGTGGVPIEISSMAVHHITESEIAGERCSKKHQTKILSRNSSKPIPLSLTMLRMMSMF